MTKNNELRKTLLIEPQFQKRMILHFCITAIAVSLLFYISMHYFFWSFEQRGVELGIPSGHEYFKFILELRDQMNILFLFTLPFILGVLIISGLSISNRVAGPISRLKKYFSEDPQAQKFPLKFREGDYFQELPDVINSFMKKKS